MLFCAGLRLAVVQTEERGLRVFENNALSGICGSKNKVVTEGRRELYD